jgi:hypothetical protein
VHRLLIAGEPVDEDYLSRFLDFLLAALNPLPGPIATSPSTGPNNHPD